MKIEPVLARILFQTDDFINHPHIKNLCDNLGLVWMTETVFPAGHFGAYFEVIEKKSGAYLNPFIHDLHFLHELYHLAYFRKSTYSPLWSWQQWARYINTIEFDVSLLTECLIYFDIPGLREKTFSHEIWVDRHMGLKGNSLEYIEAKLREERFAVYNNPDPRDFMSQQIRAYAALNMKWCQIWAHPVRYGIYADIAAFRVVEELRKKIEIDAHYREFVNNVSDSDTGIPFARQAKEFLEVFEENKKWFSNDVLLA